MRSFILEEIATDANFKESEYLLANPDVAKAVREGRFISGLQHFSEFGKSERRRLRRISPEMYETKLLKQQKLKAYLRTDRIGLELDGYFDYLTPQLRDRFNISDTDNISSLGYDGQTLALIEKYDSGLVLDVGAGRRQIYYDNVVNFEIAAYDTTDVLGVGEDLPFQDNSFDAAISIAVLEHVQDPFQCAKEIARVLKPGGQLICGVPFLQPFHSYPHHYYNMTYEGLRNLFEPELTVDKIEVSESLLPIWSLTWILRSWAEGLDGPARKEFLSLQVQDLLGEGAQYLQRNFVKNLSSEKNRELASGNLLVAHKPGH